MVSNHLTAALVNPRRSPRATFFGIDASYWMGGTMATRKRSSSRSKSVKPKYSKAAGKSVEIAVRREKRGTLRSGKGGRGGKVTSRKQAIAIGLSEARKKGARVPQKKAA
jgi:Family of unknown function (DUF6496)